MTVPPTGSRCVWTTGGWWRSGSDASFQVLGHEADDDGSNDQDGSNDD